MDPATHVLIVADGDVDVSVLVMLTARPEPVRVIAADGGAARVLGAGLVPDLVVGDFDSLAPDDRRRLEELGVELRVASPDKDESDMELCLLAALDEGASRVTIVGAMGLVRPEHTAANLLLLADSRFDGTDVVIAGRGSRLWRIGSAEGAGETTIEGETGDYVSLFALDPAVEAVTTVGLRFPLTSETLALGPARGLSNELLSASARVSTRRGRLLVIHTRRSSADDDPAGGT